MRQGHLLYLQSAFSYQRNAIEAIPGRSISERKIRQPTAKDAAPVGKLEWLMLNIRIRPVLDMCVCLLFRNATRALRRCWICWTTRARDCFRNVSPGTGTRDILR